MGLDITSITKYEIIEQVVMTEDAENDLWRIYQPEDFKSHLGDKLKDRMYLDVIECGSDFRMGYMSYSSFRDFLASLVYPAIQTEEPNINDPDFYFKHYNYRFPYRNGMYAKGGLTLEDDFVALVHFSDAEGVIGNELCKVLDAAFKKHKDKVKENNPFYHKYLEMSKCVEDAAKSGGILYFH